MKITVNVECTPEEARAFLGLPDLKPMQEALLAQLQERLSAGLQTADPETLIRSWFPAGFPGMEPVVKAMFSQFEAVLGREARK
jgi:hypothetical protein